MQIFFKLGTIDILEQDIDKLNQELKNMTEKIFYNRILFFILFLTTIEQLQFDLFHNVELQILVSRLFQIVEI